MRKRENVTVKFGVFLNGKTGIYGGYKIRHQKLG